MENLRSIRMKVVSFEMHRSRFSFVLSQWNQISQCPEFWNVSPFVKKTASQKASPSENLFPNKRTTYLRTTTRHYNKEENLSL
jgi:hypothetical protein